MLTNKSKNWYKYKDKYKIWKDQIVRTRLPFISFSGKAPLLLLMRSTR